MIRSVLRRCALSLPLAVLAAGCGNSTTSPSTTTTSTTTTTTSTTSTVAKTETFAGTLASGGTNYHIFHTLPGVFQVTLTSIEPSAVLPPVGMAFGMWDGSACTVVFGTLAAGTDTALTGTASVETDVCIKMWDPGPFDASLTLTYSLTAVHNAKG